MKAINPEQICYIKTFVRVKTDWYKIVPERETWWGKVKPEYVKATSSLMNDYDSVEEFLDEKTNYYVEHGIIYYKPHIEMYFSNKSTVTKFFETRNDMIDFIREELGGIDLKIIG